MRAHMVLLSDRGRPPSEIADLHAVSHPTVYKWIDRFDEEGPSGLYDREREGRPRELGKEARKEIERLLEGNPTEEGQNATRWTAPRIAEHLEGELGIDVHEDTVRSALKQMEYSWTRPRRKLPPTDPEAYRKRLQAVVEAVAEAGPEASVLAEDETQTGRFPPLRRQWSPAVAAGRGAETCSRSGGKRREDSLRNARLDFRANPRSGLRERPVGLHDRVP